MEIVSILSFAKNGIFIYTQLPVIDANTLKLDFMIFSILFAQFDLLSKNLTE